MFLFFDSSLKEPCLSGALHDIDRETRDDQETGAEQHQRQRVVVHGQAVVQEQLAPVLFHLRQLLESSILFHFSDLPGKK